MKVSSKLFLFRSRVIDFLSPIAVLDMTLSSFLHKVKSGDPLSILSIVSFHTQYY